MVNSWNQADTRFVQIGNAQNQFDQPNRPTVGGINLTLSNTHTVSQGLLPVESWYRPLNNGATGLTPPKVNGQQQPFQALSTQKRDEVTGAMVETDIYTYSLDNPNGDASFIRLVNTNESKQITGSVNKIYGANGTALEFFYDAQGKLYGINIDMSADNQFQPQRQLRGTGAELLNQFEQLLMPGGQVSPALAGFVQMSGFQNPRETGWEEMLITLGLKPKKPAPAAAPAPQTLNPNSIQRLPAAQQQSPATAPQQQQRPPAPIPFGQPAPWQGNRSNAPVQIQR